MSISETCLRTECHASNFYPDNPYLSDEDLRALSYVCKKIQHTCKEILERRDKCLERHLSSYTCLKMYNSSSLAKVQMYFLAELHDQEVHRKWAKAVIECLASRGPVLVILESWPSLKPFRQELNGREGVTIYPITEDLNNSGHIHYTGWDDANSVKRLFCLNQLQQDAQTKKLTKIAQINSECLSLYNKFKLTCNEIEDIGLKIKEIKQPRDFSGGTLYLEYLFANKNRFNGVEKLIKKVLEFMELRKNLSGKRKMCKDLIDEMDKFKKSCKQEIRSLGGGTFPSRTISMVNTLSGIDQYMKAHLKTLNAKIVVIAGCSHVALHNKEANIKNFQLNLFYKKLQEYKAALLFPPKQVNNYMQVR